MLKIIKIENTDIYRSFLNMEVCKVLYNIAYC